MPQHPHQTTQLPSSVTQLGRPVGQELPPAVSVDERGWSDRAGGGGAGGVGAGGGRAGGEGRLRDKRCARRLAKNASSRDQPDHSPPPPPTAGSTPLTPPSTKLPSPPPKTPPFWRRGPPTATRGPRLLACSLGGRTMPLKTTGTAASNAGLWAAVPAVSRMAAVPPPPRAAGAAW